MSTGTTPVPMPGLRRPATWTNASTQHWGRCLVAVIVAAWLLSFVVGFEAALGLLTAVGFASAIVGFARPGLGLLGVGILSTLDAPARILVFTGGIWRWNTFSYWLLIVVLLNLSLALRWHDVQTRLLQCLVAVLGIGLIISPDPISGIQHILGLVSVFGLIVYFYRARNAEGVLHWLGLVCGALSALGGVAFFMSEGTLSYVNPNAFVFFPLTGLFAICLGFSSAVPGWRKRVTLYALAASNLTLVFLTGSRGGMLVGAICAAFLMLRFGSVRSRVLTGLAAVVLGIGMSTQFAGHRQDAIHKISKMLDPRYSLTQRTSGRYDLALGAVYMFRTHPLGVGTGGFASNWRELDDVPGLSGFRRGRSMEAHGAWTKTLAENGVLGFALLAAYVVSLAFTGLRSRSRTARGLGVWAGGVLAVAFVSTSFQAKGLWLLAAGVTVLLQYGKGDDVVRFSPSRPSHP